jgi:hypothetical protein
MCCLILTQPEVQCFHVKFIYSEKATKFCEIFSLLLTTVHTIKSKVKISQNFVAFSEYMNFILLTGSTYKNNEFILHSKLSAFQFYAVSF